MHLIESGISFSEFVVIVQRSGGSDISSAEYPFVSAVRIYDGQGCLYRAEDSPLCQRLMWIGYSQMRRDQPAVAVQDEILFKVSKASFVHRQTLGMLTSCFGKSEGD